VNAPALTPRDALALGSWNTWSLISFEDGLRVVQEAYDAGIRVFDVGYYWDKPHTELVFGHYLRVLGLGPDDVEIAEKLWLWDYPTTESFVDQMKGALVRLGLDRVDTALLPRPANVGMPMDVYLGMVQELLDSGLARRWSMTNWDIEAVVDAIATADTMGVPRPYEVQLQYNLARRNVVESPEFAEFFATSGVRLQPSFTLEGGILAGKLERDRVQPEAMAGGQNVVGRNIARDAGGIRPRIRESLPELREIAARFDASTAQLALAFALLHPQRSTVLLGVSQVEQVREAVAAVDLAREHGAAILDAVAHYDVGDTVHPALFNPRLDRRLG